MIKVICIKTYETYGTKSNPLSIVNSHIFNPGDFAEIEEMRLSENLGGKEIWYYISKFITKGQTSAIWAIEFKELNKHFITPAELRDRQIDKILGDD